VLTLYYYEELTMKEIALSAWVVESRLADSSSACCACALAGRPPADNSGETKSPAKRENCRADGRLGREILLGANRMGWA